jgi:hypothetical protein
MMNHKNLVLADISMNDLSAGSSLHDSEYLQGRNESQTKPFFFKNTSFWKNTILHQPYSSVKHLESSPVI